jgi:hypothetical protein
MRRLSSLAALLAIVFTASRASAQVIDFESIQGPTFLSIGPSYTEDGFTLTAGAGEPTAFARWGTGDPQYPGSTALFHQSNSGTSTITLTQVGGGPFDLASMQISELNTGTGQSVPLNFTGTKAGGGTVTASFTLDGNFGFQTFTFNDFTNLTSVSWVQESQFHQFDLITVAPVPEPTTVLGFAALCGGALGLVRRYRRRAAQA